MDTKSISAILRLLLLVLGGFVLAQILVIALASLYGIDFTAISSSEGISISETSGSFVKNSLLLSHFLTFIIPSLIFIKLYYKNKGAEEIMLGRTLDLKLLLLAFLFLVVSYPAVTYSYTVNSWIPLADWMKTQEDVTASTLAKVLEMANIWEFSYTILIVALIPAIGEELLFRGLLQNIIKKGTSNGHLAVWISSLAFSFFHLQFEGFLPRLILGLILGYSLLWTRNLWIPMILHFLNNATPIIGLYFLDNDLAAIDPSEAQQLSWPVGVTSLILGIIVGWILKKNSNKHEYA
jgi:membrane protease YdiL (CAAX protease family)